MKKDDPFGAELKRFAGGLDRTKFKPLSSGIGWGNVDLTGTQSKRTIKSEQPFLPLSAGTPQPLNPPEILQPEARETKPQSEKPKVKKPHLIVRSVLFGLAHIFDLGIVALSSFVCLVLAALSFAPNPGGNIEASLMTWAPVKLILGLSLIEFGVLAYVLFLAYWSCLKLLVGATLGNLIFRLRAGN